MTTTHERAAEQILERFMADPEGMATLGLTHQGIKEDRWGPDFVDTIGQGPSSSWPMAQLAAFAMTHSMIFGGEVAMCGIGTAGTPERDAMREENAATLSRLPRPFRALVDMEQHMAQRDGILRWDEPIRITAYTGLINRRTDGSTCPFTVTYMIPPGSAPLEIGQSLASKTLAHLTTDEGMVARWPYGQSQITLFVNHDYLPAKNRALEYFNAHYRNHAA